MLTIVAAVAVLAPPRLPVTGARVSERRLQTLHVDAHDPKAADTNPGTAEQPLKTLWRATELALEKNRANTGVKVIVSPGIYREGIILPESKDATEATIVFEGTTPGRVILSGSDVWTGWRPGEDPDTSQAKWPNRWGELPAPAGDPGEDSEPIVRRREMVFQNGQPLGQALSAGTLRDGQFYVDEENGNILVRPSRPRIFANASIEVAVRQDGFRAIRRKNLVLRGLTFEHFAGYQQGAIQFEDCQNVLVERCIVRWNNSSGLSLRRTQDVTVRNCEGTDNGVRGLGGNNVQNFLMADSWTHRNNWRGAAGGILDGNSGAVRLRGVQRVRVVRHRSEQNSTAGMWFDAASEDVTIEASAFLKNVTYGLSLTASRGPFRVLRSQMAGNGHGLYLANSSDVTLEGCQVIDNVQSQILVAGTPDPAGFLVANAGTDDPYRVRLERTAILNSSLGAGAASNSLFAVEADDSAVWDHFTSSLRSEGNTYLFPEKLGEFTEPNPRRFRNVSPLGLEEWRARTKQDRRSRVQPLKKQDKPPVSSGSF